MSFPQKRPAKETCKRDLQRDRESEIHDSRYIQKDVAHYTMSFPQKRPAKETCKRDLQKRPTKRQRE